MAKRGSNRNRIHWLEAFVEAWDDFVAASHNANKLPPGPAKVSAQNVVDIKQREVIMARNRVGEL